MSSSIANPSSWSAQPTITVVERAALRGWFIATIRTVKRTVSRKQERKSVFAALKDFAAALDSSIDVGEDERKFSDLVDFNVSFDSAVSVPVRTFTIITLAVLRDVKLPLNSFSADVAQVVDDAWQQFSKQMSGVLEDLDCDDKNCNLEEAKADDGKKHVAADENECDVEDAKPDEIVEKPANDGKKFSWANLKRY